MGRILKKVIANKLIVFCIALLLIVIGGYLMNSDKSNANTLYPFMVDGDYGYMDKQGNITIETDYQWAGNFSEGLARVKKNGLYGFINHKGEIIIEPQFEWVEDFSEGLALFALGTDKDESDNPFLKIYGEPDPLELNEFHFGGKYGYIDYTGTIIIEAKFEEAMSFSEGKAAVQITKPSYNDDTIMPSPGKWGYINNKGKIVIDAQFEEVQSFSEGLAAVRIKIISDSPSQEWGYIDHKGNIVIETIYEMAQNFSEGIAAVRLFDIWGFINKKGEMILELQGEQTLSNLNEGLSINIEHVTTNNREALKFKFIDNQGKIYFGSEYSWAFNFSECLALVSKGDVTLESPIYPQNKWGYIDHSGDAVIDFKFLNGRPFRNGLARVMNEDKDWIYIDRNGEPVRPVINSN